LTAEHSLDNFQITYKYRWGNSHLFLYPIMNEVDYRALLAVYQQKSADMLSQIIALEAKLIVANQKLEEAQDKTTRKKPQPKTVVDAEEF